MTFQATSGNRLDADQTIREIVPGYAGMSLAPRYFYVRLTKQ
jgi:hypothetical protein